MEQSHVEPGSTKRPLIGGVSLVMSLVVLALGVRIAAAIARTAGGQCGNGGSCESSLEVVRASPGSALLVLTVIGVSSVPLVFWLRGARSNAQRLVELSDITRKLVGYFVAGFAVFLGTLFVLEPTAWWSITASIAVWILGFAVVTVSFRGDRRAQVLYVIAVLGFPVLMAWLLEAPVA